MDIRVKVSIPHPRDAVYAAYRDDVVALLPYLPNLRSVQVKSRQQQGSVLEVVSEWKGGGDVPAAIRAVLNESLLVWTDTAKWDSASFVCDWTTDASAFKGAMQCSGRNLFVPEGAGATTVDVVGSLFIDGKRLPGIPAFVGTKIAHAVERFLVDRVQDNLVQMGEGVRKHLGAMAR
jgi:hypothetical protein